MFSELSTKFARFVDVLNEICEKSAGRSNRDLMRLYEVWQKQGLPLPGALRAAQLQRLRAGGRLAHPYYWASFVAWGVP